MKRLNAQKERSSNRFRRSAAHSADGLKMRERLPEATFRSLNTPHVLPGELQRPPVIKCSNACSWLIARQLLIYLKLRRVAGKLVC